MHTFYSTGEIAHRLKVSPNTVRKWINQKKLSITAKVAGKSLVSEENLVNFEKGFLGKKIA